MRERQLTLEQPDPLVPRAYLGLQVLRVLVSLEHLGLEGVVGLLEGGDLCLQALEGVRTWEVRCMHIGRWREVWGRWREVAAGGGR